MTKKTDSLYSLSLVTKALADESRLRALRMLMRWELCVCQVIEVLRLAPSTVSKHLLILRQAGLVKSSKRGRWIYYRRAEGKGNHLVENALALVSKGLRNDSRVRADLAALKKVLAMDPETLCRKQAARRDLRNIQAKA